MKINRIIETAIYCDDVESLFNFYQDVFNFEVIQKSLPRAVFMRCGESIFILFNRNLSVLPNEIVPSHGTIGSQHFAFEVPDDEYDVWKNHLTEKNVTIDKEVLWDSRNNNSRSLYFRDPANNDVEITVKKLWDPAGFAF